MENHGVRGISSEEEDTTYYIKCQLKRYSIYKKPPELLNEVRGLGCDVRWIADVGLANAT